jgi:hypothetical protein
MGVTAIALHRKLDEITALVTEVHALLAALDIPDSEYAGQEDRPRTGWRWRHTEGAGTYVRDPNGTDRLPPGYDLTMHPHPGQPYRDPYGEVGE